MNPLGPWTEASPPPPGTRVRARYLPSDSGRAGTVLGVQPDAVPAPIPLNHCGSCRCVIPVSEQPGWSLRGAGGWVRIETDPGELTLAPQATADRGPGGGPILLCPAEGCTPLEDAHA